MGRNSQWGDKSVSGQSPAFPRLGLYAEGWLWSAGLSPRARLSPCKAHLVKKKGCGMPQGRHHQDLAWTSGGGPPMACTPSSSCVGTVVGRPPAYHPPWGRAWVKDCKGQVSVALLPCRRPVCRMSSFIPRRLQQQSFRRPSCLPPQNLSLSIPLPAKTPRAHALEPDHQTS